MEKDTLIDAIRLFREADMNSEAMYCWDLYKEQYGEDEEYHRLRNCDKVLVVAIHCEEEIAAFEERQTYKNIEIVSLKLDSEFFSRLLEMLNHSDCKYVTFLEKNQIANPRKVECLWQVLSMHREISVAICTSNYIDGNKTVIAHPDFTVTGISRNRCIGLCNQCFSGKNVLQYCLTEGVNILGTLSNIMIRREAVQNCITLQSQYEPIWSTQILYGLVMNGNIMISPEAMIDVQVSPYNKELVEKKQAAFSEWASGELSDMLCIKIDRKADLGLPACYRDDHGRHSEQVNIKKKITFFYTDKGEYYNFQPLAMEAEKRGYAVIMTGDTEAPAEIGFYCQHCSNPRNSKFSVIMLHDMEQGHTMHPNLWWWERWESFDIGILPGPAWKERWEQCAGFYYANTKKGVFELGYPKSDYVKSEMIRARADQLKQDMHMQYDKTVLYAPSWENDGKEDDFICALQKMKVNLLIKQASWPAQYAHIINNIKEQRAMHEGKYDNVHYLEPEENILVALAMSDMVVSDESSVMTEALMFGIPSLAITDWLIPDTTPSRYASVPMGYVFKCEKKEMSEWVDKILYESRYQKMVQENCDHIFGNIGNCSREILDCVEYYTMGTGEDAFQRCRLHPMYMPNAMWY